MAGVGYVLAMGAGRAPAAHRVDTAEFEIQFWSVEDGLLDNSVTSIEQTGDGFLWVGTPRGLVRFDGWSFVSVTPRADHATNLAVTAQCVDAKGHLWFGTPKHGVFRLASETEWQSEATPMGLRDEPISCLGAGEQGEVWIGTDQGLVRWQEGRFERLLADPALADPAVLGLHVTRSNGVWVSTRSGLRQVVDGMLRPARFGPEVSGQSSPFLGIFEDRHGLLWAFGDSYLLNLSAGRRFNYFRGGGATTLQVWTICEGRPGELWIGTTGQGLFHFDGGRFRAVDLWESRDHSEVRALFSDREGNLWVGTQRGGLLRLRERTVRWFSGPGGPATCLAEDPTGTIWAGFQHGGLLAGRGGVLDPATVPAPLAAQNLITTLAFNRDRTLWLGTLGNGLHRMLDGRVMRFTLAQGLGDDSILASCTVGGGRTWVSTGDGCLHRFVGLARVSFGREEGLTGDPITAIRPAATAGVWVGTSKGEVLRFEPPNRFRRVSDPAMASGKPITALLEDSAGRLWVGTAGAGLYCQTGEAWRHWTLTNGLPDNAVIGLEESVRGDLWLATARGVSRLPRTWIGGSSSSHERLPLLIEFPAATAPSGALGWPRSLRSRDGRIWLATESGVVNFAPSALQPLRPAPRVRVEAVLADGRAQPRLAAASSAAALRLPSGLRDLELQFTAPSLTFPERTRFRHQLEGFDPDWQDSPGNRRARYGRLPAGEYRFRVTASDAEGSWTGAETELALVVPPPWWLSPWIVVLEVILPIALAATAARKLSHRRLRRQLARVQAQQAMERERSRIARDMHDELGSKLTRINFLCERARNELAEVSPAANKLDSIASTSRDLLHSLDEIVWAVDPRNDSLEHLVAYLGQYTAEYLQNTALPYDLKMPGTVPEQALSAEVRHNLFLAFEEALGNALKHSKATHLAIKMTTADGCFIIHISDNGCGFVVPPPLAEPPRPPAAGWRRGGTGLRGMRARLGTIGGRCEIQSQPGRGTAITLTLPLATIEASPAPAPAL